jgi:hypothetical protein
MKGLDDVFIYLLHSEAYILNILNCEGDNRIDDIIAFFQGCA